MIVIIAILAAISIVAYTGVQQRATNSAVISSVNQSIKLISAYIAANNAYPLGSAGNYCLLTSQSSACTASSTTYPTSSTLTTNIQTIGQLPQSVPDANPAFNGITYSYNTVRTFNGVPQPVMLFYSLKGEQQQCGLPNIASNGGTTATSTTNGWTGTGGGYTNCYVSIVGPAA